MLFALAFIVASAVLIFGNLDKLIQPSRNTIARANNYLGQNYEIRINLGATDGGTVFFYNSQVHANPDCSNWNGDADIYWLGAGYTQRCETNTSAGRSYKKWRSHWVISDTGNPVLEMQRWFHQMENGTGIYSKVPVKPSDATEKLRGCDTLSFQIVLDDVPINMASLCDAHIDTLFGGDAFLANFKVGDVTLYISAESLQLIAVQITSDDGNRYLDAGLTINETEETPHFAVDQDDIIPGTLTEEWSLKSGD